MAKFHKVKRVGFEPALLFSIVGDVAAYPEFVPLCTGARVWDERTDEKGRRCFMASLDIAYPKLGFSESFVSQVVADPERLTVRARSNQKPVKNIDNVWLFSPARGGCDIDFHLDYEMSSRMMQLAIGSVFDIAVAKIMTAFEERARQIAAQSV